MLTVYDAVDWKTIPKGEPILAYRDGSYVTYPAALALAPSHCWTVTTDGQNQADIADCESGDLTPDQCIFGVRLGWWHTIYSNLSTFPDLSLAASRQGNPSWQWWAADPTGVPHLPSGASACQYAWHSLGQCPANYDLSCVIEEWVSLHSPTTTQIEENDMAIYATNSKGTGFVVATDLSSKTGIPDGADAGALIRSGLYTTVALSDQMLNDIPTVQP